MVGLIILGIAFTLSLAWLANGGFDYIKKITKK